MMQKFQMNVFSVTALGIGAMVGAGIFALLGQVIIQSASLTYVAFIISGLAAMFCGYSYAKLSAFLPNSGGITSYYEAAFSSKLLSGGLSLVYLFTLMVSIAMLAKSFAIYTLGIFEIFNPDALKINFIALVLIGALTLLNLQGSGKVGKTELWLVGTKLTILLALLVSVFASTGMEYHNDFARPTKLSFMGSIGITFFAYAGFGMMVNAAKEVSNPSTTISRAIYIAISLVIALYISLAYVVLNFIPQAEIAQSANTAVAVVAGKIWGHWGNYILSFAALIAFISGINAMFFSCYKIITALGTQKVLPVFFNHKISHNGTIGALICSIIILLAIMTFNFQAVINLSSGAFLLSYLAVLGVNWKLRVATGSSSLAILSGIILMLFITISFFISIIE